VGGITKTPEGPVVYDPDKCIGCRYCMLACPFHIPRYEWEETVPFMQKCTLCFDRQKQGKLPACVEACPQKALLFGERRRLLAVARERIRDPSRSYIARVWGEEAFGGTSVLYISDVDLSSLGWPQGSTPSIPSITKPLIAKTPMIGLGVGACLLGLNWIVRRRMTLAEERSSKEKETGTPEENGSDA
jgi:formate dehydrogenase iron-sulfur subunit